MCAALLFCVCAGQPLFSQSEPDNAVGVDGTADIEASGENAVDFREGERLLLLTDEGAAGVAQTGSSVFAMLRAVLFLALMAAAIYGIVYWMKRKKQSGGLEDPFLKVLAKTPITAKTAAAVLSVGNKAWLVGLGDAGVNLIAELNDQETIDAMRLESSKQTAASYNGKIFNFRDLLSKLGGVKKTSPEINSIQTDLLKQQRERLKGL
ncbi:hypothetical protein AGMMS50212_16010 [Spirochaetia bacterium]|nr:hypothetical protein AGMMS50212_16010 [Spirochaetia bacterium]